MIRAYTIYEDSVAPDLYVNCRIQAVNKGLWVNGNKHKIDVSQLRIYTLAEYEAYAQKYGVTGRDYFANHSSLFSAETWFQEGLEPGAR